MKSVAILVILGVGLSLLLGKELGGTASVSGTSGGPVIEARSVAAYCVPAIERVWDNARKAGDDVDGVKGKLVYATFKRAATNYCVCAQRKFGKNRTSAEEAAFGTLAGADLTLRFSNGIEKNLHQKISKDTQTLILKHKRVFEQKPEWLKTVNSVFSTCRDEQILRGKLLF